MLRLPRAVDEPDTPSTLVGAAPPRPPRRGLPLGWLAAGVVGVVALGAILAFVLTPRPDTADTAGGTRTGGPVPVAPGTADEGAPASAAAPASATTTAPTSSTTTSTTEPPEPATSAPRAAPVATCDPNYSGVCVPVAKDVDCAGTGNGPAFVPGPVRVVGEDVYRLDPNKDGVGCE
jgi:hypothetical protein